MIAVITPKLSPLCLKLMSSYKGRGSEHPKREMDKHVEFALYLRSYFKCWLGALEISTFDDLCELKILEQFKNMLPAEVAIYITEKKDPTAAEAAVPADEFVLLYERDFCDCELLQGEASAGVHPALLDAWCLLYFGQWFGW